LRKFFHIRHDDLENFCISLEGSLYRLYRSVNGHQAHQTSIHLTIVSGVQCCRHFTNLIQSQRPFRS